MQELLPLISTLVLCNSASLEKVICSPFGNKFILNHFNLTVLCIIPLVVVIATLSKMLGAQSDMSYSPSLAASVAALLVYHIFYLKRSHKNGGLLSTEQCGKAVITYSCVLYFVTSSTINHEINTLMPFFLGSITVSAFTALFAAVADTWYSIGTGQFFMVSLDTFGILVYFILPIMILFMRFVEKYEGIIHKLIQLLSTLISTHLDVTKVNTGMDIQTQLHRFTVILLTLPALIGVPLTQNLCPINGHLFGQVYTHGNPNTKKSAICINFSDYKLKLKKVSEGGVKIDTLNIFVTLYDLKESSDLVKKLYDMGHLIGLRCDENDYNIPQTFKEASDFYLKVIGSKPLCYHTGIDYSGRHPSCYHAATILDMKSITWSTIVTSMSSTDYVTKDLTKHNGGSIVYLGTSNEDVLIKVFSIFKDHGTASEKLPIILNGANAMNL